ncbi:hypothetical protein HC248_01424 [Polaromonas vacuolata]|uniref:Uncharacterized protein n=1 Tax=Polaromonas vacuolata TaxID=37448 RepID=A0A6H2H8E1_9BURK|nr:hypothetical protein [Polaromonas vacuolata]QJC56138.1 hypothetical protein HC248_01424 [Polaromonas vacuolata]
MAVVTPPTISTLPAAPDPNDRATFNARAYPWAVAQAVLATEVNAVASNVAANATDAKGNADIATSQAGLATTNGAEQVALAADQVALADEGAQTASIKAGIATTKATEALTSAADAETSRVDASKLNLGNKSAVPTLDNQGSALLAGATYYDTVLNKWRVWTGSAWGDGISAVAGVSSVNGQSGAVTGIAKTSANTFTGLQTNAAGADMASAATIDLTLATGNTAVITGTVATSALTMAAGQQMLLLPSGAWPMTFNATTMNINGGVDQVCAAGDRVTAVRDRFGVVRVELVRQSGAAVVVASAVDNISFPTNISGNTVYVGTAYIFLITNFDSEKTYIISTGNGTVTRLLDVLSYTPGVPGTGSFVINGRTVGPYTVPPVAAGQQEFTTPGTFTWVVPTGVTSVSVVTVGAGNNFVSHSTTITGGGGALGYKNSVSVTPGASIEIVVGSPSNPGGTSRFGTEVGAEGGKGGNATQDASGFAYSNPLYGSSGGRGVSKALSWFGGGGGAGGYSGDGGYRTATASTADGAGGGGGAGGAYSGTTGVAGCGGGGRHIRPRHKLGGRG